MVAEPSGTNEAKPITRCILVLWQSGIVTPLQNAGTTARKEGRSAVDYRKQVNSFFFSLLPLICRLLAFNKEMHK